MGRDTRGISDTGPGPPDTAGNLIDSQFAQEDMMKVVSAAPEGFFAWESTPFLDPLNWWGCGLTGSVSEKKVGYCCRTQGWQ